MYAPRPALGFAYEDVVFAMQTVVQTRAFIDYIMLDTQSSTFHSPLRAYR